MKKKQTEYFETSAYNNSYAGESAKRKNTRLGCQPCTPAAFTPKEIFLLLISVRGWVDPQGHSAAGRIMSIKFSKTQSRIEPATFRLVAQCLNQLPHRVYLWKYVEFGVGKLCKVEQSFCFGVPINLRRFLNLLWTMLFILLQWVLNNLLNTEKSPYILRNIMSYLRIS
jgi:hypothetical protein